MEPEGSSPCSQKSTTGSYPEPYGSRWHHHTLLTYDTFYHHHFIYATVSKDNSYNFSKQVKCGGNKIGFLTHVEKFLLKYHGM